MLWLGSWKEDGGIHRWTDGWMDGGRYDGRDK